jgi:DNA-binding response OmpR family regulator
VGPVPGPRSPMTRTSRSALIVSDSAPLRRYMTTTLEAVHFGCTQAIDGFDAMDRLSERLFDIYAVDLDMPASDGMAIFAITLTGGFRDPSPVVVGISSRSEEEDRTGPWANGANLAALIAKPFRPDDLIAAAHAALLIQQKSRRQT